MKNGIPAKIVSAVMHGAGLKKKYRSYPDDTRLKGKQTMKKGK